MKRFTSSAVKKWRPTSRCMPRQEKRGWSSMWQAGIRQTRSGVAALDLGLGRHHLPQRLDPVEEAGQGPGAEDHALGRDVEDVALVSEARGRALAWSSEAWGRAPPVRPRGRTRRRGVGAECRRPGRRARGRRWSGRRRVAPRGPVAERPGPRVPRPRRPPRTGRSPACPRRSPGSPPRRSLAACSWRRILSPVGCGRRLLSLPSPPCCAARSPSSPSLFSSPEAAWTSRRIHPRLWTSPTPAPRGPRAVRKPPRA